MNGNISEPWIRCHNLLAGETQAGSLKFASRKGAPTYKANLSSVTAENPKQNKVEIEDHILSWCLNKRGRICWVNLRVSSLSTWPTVWPRAPKPPLISFNKESILKRCCYSSTPPIACTYSIRIDFLYSYLRLVSLPKSLFSPQLNLFTTRPKMLHYHCRL